MKARLLITTQNSSTYYRQKSSGEIIDNNIWGSSTLISTLALGITSTSDSRTQARLNEERAENPWIVQDEAPSWAAPSGDWIINGEPAQQSTTRVQSSFDLARMRLRQLEALNQADSVLGRIVSSSTLLSRLQEMDALRRTIRDEEP